MRALEARRRAALALLAVLFLLAVLSALRVNPFAAIPLFLAVFAFLGYAREAGRVLGEEAARRLRGELGALEGLLWALEELHPAQDRPQSG